MPARTIKAMPATRPQPARAVVLTISDSRTRGERPDLSGPAVAASLQSAGFLVEGPYLIADEQPQIESALRTHAASAQLVVTTGGTGIAPRDVTPEATRAVCTRILDGFAERMRAAGVKVTSARGEVVQFSPTVRNIFVEDPNGLNVELFESKP